MIKQEIGKVICKKENKNCDHKNKLELPIWNFKLEGGKMARKLIHICEVCGKTELLTPEEAFNEGWDYPPRMGGFGIVGPRTCGNCPINLTVWWALVSEKKSVSELSQQQKETIKRIQEEPESIMPKEENRP